MTAETLQKLQQEDPSLDGVRRAAKGEPSTATGIGFFERDGLVYRQWTPPGMPDDPDMAIEQLVLPSACRNAVLKLAHEIPLAGHMGKTKTTRRVLQRFYWPTVYRDVAKFCRSCGQCQKSSTLCVQRAPLVSLPVVSEPFSRIGMDIVGPLLKPWNQSSANSAASNPHTIINLCLNLGTNPQPILQPVTHI